MFPDCKPGDPLINTHRSYAGLSLRSFFSYKKLFLSSSYNSGADIFQCHPMRIFVFNPDVDFARACDSDFYTAPSSVASMAATRALIMSSMASKGDIILCQDKDKIPQDEYSETLKRDISVLTDDELRQVASYAHDDIEAVIPWGWSRQIRHRLRNCGVPENILPDDGQLDEIRRLSHRGMTIPISAAVSPDFMPERFTDTSQALIWLDKNPEAFIKAPWSSSGRGVLRTSDLELRHIEPWIRGTIRRQGCVIAEREDKRVLDFASEWTTENGKAIYCGVSVFEVSPRGKYNRNINAPQITLRDIIEKETGTGILDNILEKQRRAIEENVAPYYSGPLGIDMYKCADGRVRGCVELNLRLTMGHIAIFRACDEEYAL